jgi:protein SCO1/2
MIRLVLLLALFAGPAAAFDPFAVVGIDGKPGAAVPLDRPFRDQHGRPATLAGIAAGRPILLVPVLHACPNICGVTLAGLAQAIAAQPNKPGRDFAFVAFGIDPDETSSDAAASLERLTDAFPGAAPVDGVTGAAADVAAVTGALGYRYGRDPATGEIAHSAAAAVLTPDGRLAAWLNGIAPDPQDLRLALAEASRGQLGGWRDQLLLLCFHYDPRTGRYDDTATLLLRAAGGVTATATAFLIALALLRERRRRQ